MKNALKNIVLVLLPILTMSSYKQQELNINYMDGRTVCICIPDLKRDIPDGFKLPKLLTDLIDDEIDKIDPDNKFFRNTYVGNGTANSVHCIRKLKFQETRISLPTDGSFIITSKIPKPDFKLVLEFSLKLSSQELQSIKSEYLVYFESDQPNLPGSMQYRFNTLYDEEKLYQLLQHDWHPDQAITQAYFKSRDILLAGLFTLRHDQKSTFYELASELIQAYDNSISPEVRDKGGKLYKTLNIVYGAPEKLIDVIIKFMHYVTLFNKCESSTLSRLTQHWQCEKDILEFNFNQGNAVQIKYTRQPLESEREGKIICYKAKINLGTGEITVRPS